MGNVLLTQRLVRLAARSDASGNLLLNSVLQLVEQHPALLRAKCAALKGTVWHWAASRGHVVLLEGLIRLVIRTHTAAGAVHQGLCQLLNQGVNLDTTPLMLACKYGHAEAVRTLLQHGADPQLSDRRGNNTCLHTAAYAGHASVIRVILNTPATYPLLLEAGVAHAPASAGEQQQPGLRQQQERGTTSLLDRGNLYELTALHMAVCMSRAEAAQVLLEAGASLGSSSKFPAQVGHLYLPHRTTPLHAAVHARDRQCAMLLLTAHEQRYGGTAAGRASDPRRLLDGNRQLPGQLARHMQMPDAFCELLYPLTPWREHLQLLAAQQQQQDLPVQQQGLPMPQHLCRSLQELAGLALKEALLSQLRCVMAAAGVGGSHGGEQQQPQAIATAEALNAVAAELFLMLQDAVMVCVSITPSERLCVQLGVQHNCQQAAAVDEQPTGVVQLSQLQSLLDVVRLYILCHGLCDPGEPSSCWFADACPSCLPPRNVFAPTECHNWSLQDLQCSFMPASQCIRLQGAATIDHNRLVALLQSIESACAARWSVLQGAGSWREACGVCFEEEGLLLQLKPCKHVLCITCVKLLVGLVSNKPAFCPFCRAAIAGLQVHL